MPNENEPFDTIIKILSLDNLVSRAIIRFKDKKHRELAVDGDDLLNLYIIKLDEEIYLDPPEGLDDIAKTIWEEKNYGLVFSRVLDYVRIHSWACIQFYKGSPEWRIFSEKDKESWLKDKKGAIIGVKVSFGITEEDKKLYFGKKQCYLLKYQEGDNKSVFAYPDLNYAIWKIATKTREIQFQLDIMGCKPEFYHVVYGNPSKTQRTAIMNVMDDVSVVQALGATENAVKRIDVVEHKTYSALMEIIKEKKRAFAGLTRLPLAFYNGERESGSGTGGAAENVVELKIDKRKQMLFKICIPLIKKVFLDRHSINISELKLKEIEAKPITENPNEKDDKDNG